MLVNRKNILLGIGAVCLIGACGIEEQSETESREDLAMVGGKADVPYWMRHIPTDWGCDQTLSGDFMGLDSAHLYSFPGKIGYKYTFTFQASTSKYKGAALAVYDAETGLRVALARKPYGNSAAITYVAEKNVKYLVAVYTVQWFATGSYTLSAACELLVCQSNLDCGQEEYCSFASGCGAAEGICTIKPNICYKVFRPVCGCDGMTYSNDCMAHAAGVSVSYQGECSTEMPELTITTDKPGYTAGEMVQGTIANETLGRIFLPGCVVFDREELVNGAWTSLGPDRVCVWEGFAVEVQAGAVFSDATHFLGQGTYRLSTSFSTGCLAGKPISQAQCKASYKIYSEPFQVKICPLLMIPNPETFCPEGDVVAVRDADGICIASYQCKPSCFTTGCSGQVCAETSVITTCDYPQWYSCFAFSECGRFGTDNSCGWQQTEDYLTCRAQFGM